MRSIQTVVTVNQGLVNAVSTINLSKMGEIDLTSEESRNLRHLQVALPEWFESTVQQPANTTKPRVSSTFG